MISQKGEMATMRDLDHIQKYSVPHPIWGEKGKGKEGMFRIPFKKKYLLMVIASDGGDEEEWEHVSVSLRGVGKGRYDKRLFNPLESLPTWEMMCFVKDLFFEKDETVIQFHPPEKDYVNIAEVLHLWRKKDHEVELPPLYMV